MTKAGETAQALRDSITRLRDIGTDIERLLANVRTEAAILREIASSLESGPELERFSGIASGQPGEAD